MMHPRVRTRVEWAVAKARSAVLLTRAGFDESEHPRDDHGRWTDAGGGDSGPSEPSPTEPSPSGKGTVIHSKNVKAKGPDSPIKVQIVHDPSTGNKKPYEIWMHYKNYPPQRKSSFKTEQAALKSFWWTNNEEVDAGGFVSPSPEDFIAARDETTRPEYLSPLKPDDLTGHTLITTPDKKAGVAIDPKGDLQNLFNNGGPKGIAADLVAEAISKGARTLDCYAGYLPDYYHQFGFVETGRIKFNPEFAHGWKAEDGTPDVVFMAWRGYLQGGEKGAIERAKSSKDKWIPNEQTSSYASDYDSAKEHSRVVAGRKSDHRLSGKELRAPAHRAGNQSVAQSGAGDRRSLVRRRVDWAMARAQSAVLLRRAYDESEHPRDEHGRWTDAGASPSEPPTLTQEEHNFLISQRPSQEKIDKWDDELTARQAELEKAGKSDSDEYRQLGNMQSALRSYGQESEENINKGNASLTAIYHVDDNKLLSTAFTYEQNNKAVIQHFGATNHNAGVKALSMVATQFDDKVGSIEGQAASFDNATQAMFEAADFKVKEGSTGPYVTYVKETSSAIYSSPVHAAAIFGASQASARLLGYDPNLVSINMGEHPFTVGTLGGYKAAGLAHLDTGKIEIFPRQIFSADGAVSVTAHEIAHQKYQTVINAVSKEREAVMADPDTKEGMRADGSLKPPLDEKYPLYSRFVKYEGDVFHKLIDDDGVTPYSTAYWKATKESQGQQVTILQSTHETIAELARLQVDTGKLQGTPVWRRYYRDIMKTYDELQKQKK